MNLTDIVALLVVLLVVGAAVAYIVREKRRGVVCVGCAVGKSCAENRKTAQRMQVGSGCSSCSTCSSSAQGECPCAPAVRLSE